MSRSKFIIKLLFYLKKIGLEGTCFYDHLYWLRVKEWSDDTITRLYGNVSHCRRIEIKKGMREAFLKFHWTPSEYFHFHYEQLTDADRSTFMSEYDKNRFCEKVNSPKESKVTQNKWLTYLYFKEFFKRDAVLLKDISQLQSSEVLEFIENHNSFVVKAVLDFGGHGIFPIFAQSKEEAIEKLTEVILQKKTAFILEELIHQSDSMARFHPQSVNSIRIYTVKVGEEVHIIMPMMRCGLGESFVDNISSGGLTSLIDYETGVITKTIKNKTHLIEKHPNTGVQMVGAVIPDWQDAISMVKKMAMVLPGVKYAGWDLAHTDNGWVMIEGNDQGQVSGGQSMMKQGIKPELERLRDLIV